MRQLLSQAYRAGKEIATWGAAGFPVSALRDARLSICAECPRFVQQTRFCQVCGCFMPAKAMMATSSCPEDRWPNVTGAAPGSYEKQCGC